MSAIKIENLTFSYPESYDNIFEDVSFQIDTDWKLGFVGRNGRGKTTFLQLLTNRYEYSGRTTSPVEFGYFPCVVYDRDRLTEDILSEICPEAQNWQIIRELSYLDMDAEVLYRPFNTLSGGEQTKALLCALFLDEGRFLLIDEPTNHLDMKAREKMASYLKRKKGFILVSHDRTLLDGCTDHTLSLNKTDIEVQSGNFSSFMENFQRQQDFEKSRSEKLEKDIVRLKKTAKQKASWSDKVEASKIGAADKGFVGHRAAKMMKRSKAIEARQQQAIAEKSQLLGNFEKAEDLKLSPLDHRSDPLVSFSDVSIYYGDRTVCSHVSFSLRQGKRLIIEGKNGSGKSSLLKLLAGEDISHTGIITRSSGLVISYVPQDTGWLRGSLSSFAAENHLDESIFKAILRKMDFERVQFEKDMSEFSEGQKKKVLIAKSLSEKAHIYVWDEPLNFIDVYSRMQIENLIARFSPAMVLAEHDRYFCEAIEAEIISLD